MMGVAVAGTDSLSERAAKMRESLQKSQTITDNAVSILGSVGDRLSVFETAMRPTQIRTHSIRKAHENIDRTSKATEVLLTQFDLFRQAETKIRRGLDEDLESYLEAIEQIRSNIKFFSSKEGFKSSDKVLINANNLLAEAISKLDFKQLLASYSKPVEPDRLFACLPNSLRPSSGSPGHQGDSSSKSPSNHHSEQHKSNLENADYIPPAQIPPRILPLLHDLAQQMFQAGHQQQLLKIYRDTRSSVLEESLRKLGVEKLSKDDVQKMQWEVLEAKIGNWIHFMRIAVKLLFAGERVVCDQIFEGFDSLPDQCFFDVTSSSVSVLLSFGDAIAKSNRSPKKLFVLLDMFEIMRELHSEIELKFKGTSCKDIRESAFGLTKQLAQTAQETLGDFEAVETKTAVSDGTIHPLTIDFVKFLFDYHLFQRGVSLGGDFSGRALTSQQPSQMLGILQKGLNCLTPIPSYQSTLKQLCQVFDNEDETRLRLASVMTKLMQDFQTNLYGKSKQCKDIALTHLFLMNNIHYVVRFVLRSGAKDWLGDDWVQRQRRIVQQIASSYIRSAWLKILQCLSMQGIPGYRGGSSIDGGNSSRALRAWIKERLMRRLRTFKLQSSIDGGNSSGAARALIKKRFRTFNMQFEELYQKQSQWTVPDTELRESLKLAVAVVLLPAYRSFVKHFRSLIQNYIQYTEEDLERMLGELFEGRNLNEPRR